MIQVSDLRPCILERKILPKVWGGRALETLMGIELPADENIGETWELYDRADGSSPIRGTDETLRDWMERDATDLLGAGVSPTRDGYFPLLIKYIDAADKLSVQVHPDDEMARSENDSGKSEAWVVLGKSPGAQIVCGLKPGISAEEFAAVAHTDAVEDALNIFEPEVGDSIYVPAGTVHAIGPGVVVFEVQQNSDVTYRFYDWGRPREIHVEKGLQATRLGDAVPPVTGGDRMDDDSEWLFRNEFFTTRRTKVRTPVSLGTEGSFKAISVVKGRGTLGWHSGGSELPILLSQGDTVLVPASIEITFLSPIGEMDLLVCGPGETH
jgi:mannose-6-phosphate isomerase